MESEEKQPARLTTAHSRELGEELRQVRHRARMSSGFVAEELGWSLGKLSKLETGSRGTSTWEISALLGRCGAGKAARDHVLAIASEADTGSFVRLHEPFPDDLTALALHERMATTITTYEPLTIPGLAQTEDYTHALTGDPDLVRVRTRRQEHLRRSGGPDLVLYIHEAALRSVVGNAAVMRDQLLRLALMCGWAGIDPRVVPMSAPSHAALRHPATLLTFAAPTRPMAYAETDTATVFQDDPRAVATYRAKIRHLERVALTAEHSRELFARWADAYDRQAA